MILADFSSFLGSVWFALMLCAVGVGVGVYLCKSGRIK
jgi:hypothetical protein